MEATTYRTPRFDLYVKSQAALRKIEREVPKLRKKFLCENIVTEDIDKWVKYQAELEKSAPYGRCCLCNLALEKSDTERTHHSDMHQNCMNDHYGD